MSCCIGGVIFGGDENGRNKLSPNDVYSKSISLNVPKFINEIISEPTGMSTTDTMRVPHIPLTSRNVAALKIAKAENSDKPSFSGNYRSSKISSPTSSAENIHIKTPSSDSSTSRENIPQPSSSSIVASEKPVQMRQPIPAITCYDFVAKHGDELSFKRGSKVFVKSKNLPDDDEYVMIEVDGREGYAPKNALQAEGAAPPVIDGAEIQQFQKLGGGTFSDVYQVQYHNQKYAFKNYKVQDDYSKALEEAKLINSLRHKNIIEVYGICQKPVALLLELCEGKQLIDLWKDDCEDFNPPLRVILNWAKQIAEGLWFMHDRDLPICHADIKPQNCMLLEEPCTCDTNNYRSEDLDKCSVCGLQRLSRLTIKLTDFGLSKVSETRASNPNPQKECPFGSIPYMSPESIRQGKITQKSDVWSYGVLFWEILTKQVPYHELECVNGVRSAPAAIMFAIGKREVHLEISDSWPWELQNLLQRCWEEEDETRPTMGEVIKLIDGIPTTNPDYVMVGGPKKNTTQTNIEKFKSILNQKMDYFFPKVKAPPRKLTANDIGPPSNFHAIISLKNDNGAIIVRDLEEEDRQRNLSANDNINQWNGGTLPRGSSSHQTKGISSATSTPELNQIGLSQSSSSKLQRKPAIKKRQNARCPDQSINNCQPSTLGTPSSDTSSFIFDTVDVAEDPAPISSLRISQDSRKSPRRSPSSHSQSTFYVSVDENDATSPYEPHSDWGTFNSRTSTDSRDSRKKPGFLSLNKWFRKKNPTQPSNVCYDSSTGLYNSLKSNKNNFNSIEDDEIPQLFPSPHLQTATLSLYIRQQNHDAPTTSHYLKQSNTAKKQRQQTVVEHRRNASNSSERIHSTTALTPTSGNPPPPPRSPMRPHHSSSDAASIASSSYLSTATTHSPSRTSLSFGTVIPMPSTSPIRPATCFPATNDEPFDSFSNSPRNRAFTTASSEAPPFLHPRSRSTDIQNAVKPFDELAHRIVGNNYILENLGYEPTNKKPEHYVALRSSPAIQHPRQSSGENEMPAVAPPQMPTVAPPPLPPRGSVLNTVVEIPRSHAPILSSPRLHHSQSASPNPTPSSSASSSSSSSSSSTTGYSMNENATTPSKTRNINNNNLPISPSSSSSVATTNPHYVQTCPGRLSDEIPHSIAPQRRPDTLELETTDRQKIERNPNNGYVQLGGQITHDDVVNRMPRMLPNNISHNRR